MAKTSNTKAKTKAKVVSEKPVEKKVPNEVTINLDTFATPIAIVVAGIIIALTIFFVNKGNGNEYAASGQGGNPTAETGDGAPEVPQGDVTVALGDDPYIGDKSKAKVAVVEYSDYQCGYCVRHSQETFPDIKTNYIDTGKIIYVFKEYPLSNSGLGYESALGGTCVFNQLGGDKFAEFHKGSLGAASAADVRAQAVALGVDGAKYDACVSSAQFKDEIDGDRAEGSSAGVSGTPGFVVGVLDKDGNITGPLVAGAYPYETFQAAIDSLLE